MKSMLRSKVPLRDRRTVCEAPQRTEEVARPGERRAEVLAERRSASPRVRSFTTDTRAERRRTPRVRELIGALAALTSVACSSSSSSDGGGSGGSTNGSGGSAVASGGSVPLASGGTPNASSGGAAVAGSSSGGAATGGNTTSSGGALASGGSISGGGASSGGSVTGGSGGAVGGGGASGSDSTPVGLHGQLQVVGNQLQDAHGVAVQLKGPSSMWLNWESQKFAEDKQGLQWMRDNWHASIIRAAMGVSTTDTMDNDYLSAPDAAKEQVNQIVQNAIDLGMYVIIDWHDSAADTHQDQAVAFFTEMAQKWGAYPNVLYEPFNEPQRQTWDVIKAYHNAVIAAVRAIDPDNVMILGTPNWSQFVDVVAADTNRPQAPNLMYTLHFYSCTHTQKNRDLGETAFSQGLPIFVTEWGATDADGGTARHPDLCLDEAQRWHDWMNGHKISWAAWKFDQCADQTCYFSPNATVSTTGNWGDDVLNGHTAFVRDRMKE
jgi:endoglucanase